MSDRKLIKWFLGQLFPEVPDNAAILIWTPKGKKSYWATSVEYDASDSGSNWGLDNLTSPAT